MHSALVDTAKQISKIVLPVYNSPVAYESFPCFTTLLTLGIFCLFFHFNYSDGYSCIAVWFSFVLP